MNVVEKVNLILKKANISKVNLSKYLGVSRQMVYNYFDGDDVYVIKPNQRRFWSQTTAMEDSKSLLVEILNMKK